MSLKLFYMFKYFPVSWGGGAGGAAERKPMFSNSWASDAHTGAERDKDCQPHLYTGSRNSDDWDTDFARPALIP